MSGAGEQTSIENGLAIIKGCLTRTECLQLVARVESITGAGTRCLLDQVWCQTLVTLIRNRIAISVPEIRPLVAVQCTFFNKSMANNWFVAFHQDRSIPVGSEVSAKGWPGWSRKENMTFIQGPDELLARMVAVRLHIDDSTPDNGPLRVLHFLFGPTRLPDGLAWRRAV